MRGKKQKNSIDFKYIILIITFIVTFLLCITVYSVKKERKLTFIESAIKDSALFVGKIIYVPIDFTVDAYNNIKDLINIRNKYNEIKKDKKLIDSYKNEIKNLKEDVKELKELNELKNVLSMYETKNATIVSRDHNYWYNSITINVGKVDGIEKGMAVTSNGALIGKIETISNFTSVVKLLSTDTLDNKISVELKIADTSIYGLLTRYDLESNTYFIEGISENVEIPKNSLVTTSGLSDKFPNGIMIGYVKEVTTDSFDLARILKVKPITDFNDINYVSVLLKENN